MPLNLMSPDLTHKVVLPYHLEVLIKSFRPRGCLCFLITDVVLYLKQESLSRLVNSLSAYNPGIKAHSRVGQLY